jgi:putative transposase
MPRRGRYFLPDQPQHVIQRGNDRQPIFFADDDYVRLRDWLQEGACRHLCAVHAYVIMTNHVHLLVTPATAESVPRLMQSLGRRYVRHVNDTYRRTGTLWEGRYRAAPIDSEAYLLSCHRYIELNPVRARMVADPTDYPWSSHAANARGAADPLVRPHALYLALAATAEARRDAYRRLFDEALDEDMVAELRAATNGGWAIGGARFKEQIAAKLRRRVAPLPPGRPPKSADLGGQIDLLPENPL